MATISSGSLPARSSARRDLPLAVGPSRTTAVPGKLATAGDVDDGAGGVRGLVGRDPQDGLGDFLRLAGSREGRGGANALQARRVAAGRMDLGAYHPRAHRIDADAFGGHFLRKADGEGVDRALRRGIVDVVAGRTEARGGGGEIDDDAA